MILHLKNRLETIASASESIGRIDIELERLRAIIATNDAKVAQARENYVEMRTQFIRTLVKAETKADFDALLADYHGLVNAGLSQCALSAANNPVHRDITRLINEQLDAVGYRERAWAAVVQGNEPAPLRPDDPTPPAQLDRYGMPLGPEVQVDRYGMPLPTPAELAQLPAEYPAPLAVAEPPAALNRDQAIQLALQAEQELLAKPHPPRLRDAPDTSSIQDQLYAVLRNAGRPMAVAAVHQEVQGQLSLAQVRDNLSVLYRAGRVKRLERGIYDCR